MQANEVTKLLGINRDRIKYFRKQEVFEPEHPPVGNKSPEYTQTDIDNLKTLVILTKAGLSCGDIRKIQTGEWTMSQALSERKQMLLSEIQRMQGSVSLVSELLNDKVDYQTMNQDFYWNLIARKEAEGMDFVDVEAMYGAETAQRLAGLRLPQMQLYVDDGLIHPVKAAKAHAAQNTFTENEIEQMKAVAILRRYLGVQEIKQFQAYPENTKELLQRMSENNGVDLCENEEVLAAIQKLQLLVRDASDLKKLRKETKDTPIPRAVSLLVGLGILVFLGWDMISASFQERAILIPVLLSICSVLCLISGFMTFRYGTALRRGAKAKHHAVGTVVRVKEEAGFPASFSRAGANNAAGSEPGRGRAWVFYFLFWYQLRPDRWYPTIRFENENGVQALSTFCYGGMKNDWTEGEQLEVAWNDYRQSGLLPCSGNWMKRKTMLYAVVSVLLLAFAVLVSVML